MPREAWVIDLRNAYHQKQKTYIKHSSGFHPGETFYLIAWNFAPFSRLNLRPVYMEVGDPQVGGVTRLGGVARLSI